MTTCSEVVVCASLTFIYKAHLLHTYALALLFPPFNAVNVFFSFNSITKHCNSKINSRPDLE